MRNLLPIVFVLFFLSACESGNEDLMPTITGKAFEVVVVMEDGYWEGPAGKIVRDTLGADMDGLLQSEPVFSIVRIASDAFNNLFRTHRNILRINIHPDNRKQTILYSSNVYAKPQLVVDIKAESPEKFLEIWKRYGKEISDKFVEKELSRIISNYSSFESTDIGTKLRKQHALSLTVPKGYIYDVDQANFAWITLETPKHSQGLIMYYYDYESPDQLEPERLIAKRNLYTRKYVPGPIEGTYMSTETELPVESSKFMKDSLYYVEMRGLWKLEGPDFMGGPFVSLTTVDTLRQRIITVEGYVYAPKDDKRNYVRQVEAIIHSLQIAPLDPAMEVTVE